MDRRQFALFAAAAGALTRPDLLFAAGPPDTWDGLVRVPSRRLNFVFLLPGADFSGYHKVMLDPTEVAFDRNWQRDYNNSQRALTRRITASDIEAAITQGQQAGHETFTRALTAGGWAVVTAPGEDVLRVRPGIINVRLSAPAKLTAGRSRTYAGEAGSATLLLEARDSVTDALLGRAVDARVAGDTSSLMMPRTTTTNRADFQALMNDWARRGVDGLNELKARSPIAA